MSETDRLAACSAALTAAPFEAGGWRRAVDWFAEATESRGGQLIGRASSSSTPFRVVTPNLEAAESDWIDNGGLEPSISPMVRSGLKAPILKTFTDTDVLSLEERRHSVLWRSVYERWDIPHVACTVLWRKGNDLIVLAAVRSAADGYFTTEDRHRLSALMPRWRAAIALTAALKEEGALLMAGGLDAASVSAFVLDAFGRVVATTTRAETLINEGRWFQSRGGILFTKCDRNNVVLIDAMNRSRHLRTPVCAELIDPNGVLDVSVAQLPRNCEIGFGATALVVCTQNISIPQLTPAERAIARSLIEGFALTDIAEKRCTSTETVRGQAKAIYAKAGVGGQLELIRRFAAHEK